MSLRRHNKDNCWALSTRNHRFSDDFAEVTKLHSSRLAREVPINLYIAQWAKIGNGMQFRLYLLDGGGHVRAAEFFAATSNEEASAIAATVHEACSDIFPGYEIWRGEQRIVAPRGHDGTNIASMIAKRQESILDLEERLQRAFQCVQRSQKMLEKSALLRDGLRVSGGGEERSLSQSSS